MNFILPKPIITLIQSLNKAGFEAFLVGGCVRDLIMDKQPKDWDITTSATPKEIQKLFPDSFYENEFGTVGIKVEPFLPMGKEEREHDIVEVTTYRTESAYSDKRRPDTVTFSKSLAEDLQRRDFTMNAIALSITECDSSKQNEEASCDLSVTDPYDGVGDIQRQQIRAVGDPHKRFGEDALRMMRAVRFHSELGFEIEAKTFEAIRDNAPSLKDIARERIRIELERIIQSDHPSEGITLLQKCGLLRYIIRELEEGIDVTQNLHHIYTVWEHNILALKTCPSKKLSVRLAALLHDVGKPRTKRGEGKYATFYNHDHVGARMTKKILQRLTFPKEVVEKASLLVDQHLFYYNVDEVTEAAVRRIVARVGRENIQDLIDVRIGDRLGSGVPKAKPYRLRHFEYMVEKVSKDPLSVKMLKINGRDLMKELGITPGPKIGAILEILLGDVIEDPGINKKERLLQKAEELNKQDLQALLSIAKKRIEKQKEQDEKRMKEKYWVK